MSKEPSPEIKEFMKTHGLTKDEVWCVHNTNWVVKHKALERIAAEAGIILERPATLETNSAAGIVALIVFGRLGDRQEWSTGEASPKNNKTAYPYAIAEKRAKDRVILKLLDSKAGLYSSVDDFETDDVSPKKTARQRFGTEPKDIVPMPDYDENGEIIDNIPLMESSAGGLTMAQQDPVFKALQALIHGTGSTTTLRKLGESKDFKEEFKKLRADWQDFMRGVYTQQMTELFKLEEGDDMRMAG